VHVTQASRGALAAIVPGQVDSILVTAKGYQSKIVPVTNYVSVINIVLSAIPTWSGTANIDAVFFAQTHVLEDTSKYLRLVSNREALIKVHVISPVKSLSPQVYAVLALKGKTFNLKLAGPDTLPVAVAKARGLVQHSYANSFTAIIPKEWVQRGLKITVEAGNKTRILDSIKIGAPNVVKLRMFDMHYFVYSPADYPAGWLQEFESKRPVSEIQLQRLPKVIFPALVIPPRGAGLPAVRIKSKAEYQTITGQPFDGEQAAALVWNGALKAANGMSGRIRMYYMNIYGAFAGGQAGGFSGVGAGNSLGILNHEAGHSFSLPHWGDNVAYPYKGDMFGIPAPAIYNKTHAGPAWAFDLPGRRFIPCTVQPNSVGGVAGTYKGDPMQGGGVGDQEKGYLMRHFSDYSVSKMQSYLEGHIVVWNDSLKSYASWNDAAGDYVTKVTNNGVQYPVVRDVEVISVMAGVSAVTPQANLVYPPIGPYEAGLITLFDPTIAADRLKADSILCPTGGCDVSLKVTQGGKIKTYMLPIALDTLADPFAAGSFQTRAVNLPASGGTVTKVEMLSTPDAEKNGVPAAPKVLDTWQ
ncbi:MAG: M66 family metalloprotease, partial [Chitinispirillaceae bacterium]|nr:M66 family metalloprotease [Chitinispirillaceae bacterium]